MSEIAPTFPRRFCRARSILEGVYGSNKKLAARFVSRSGLSSRSGGFIAVLLVGALLLCHGVLGFAHQASCHAGCEARDTIPGSLSAHDEHASGNEGGHAGAGPTDASNGGQGAGSYFAVFLVLFGVALLGLLLGARRRGEHVTLRHYRPRFLPTFVCLPRGPMLPLLQVFRL